ncbi:hypothetical protein YC2023_083112 [Brassica napus]
MQVQKVYIKVNVSHCPCKKVWNPTFRYFLQIIISSSYMISQHGGPTLVCHKVRDIFLFIIYFCDPEEAGSCDSGCNGGLMNSAFEYTLKTGGLVREEDYPYTGKDGATCKLDKSKIVASVSNFSVISIGEEQIAANLVKNGPLAVAINAAYMQTYIGGVSCPYICMRRLNHGVLEVVEEVGEVAISLTKWGGMASPLLVSGRSGRMEEVGGVAISLTKWGGVANPLLKRKEKITKQNQRKWRIVEDKGPPELQHSVKTSITNHLITITVISMVTTMPDNPSDLLNLSLLIPPLPLKQSALPPILRPFSLSLRRFTAYLDATKNESRGLLGILAQKSKSILEEDEEEHKQNVIVVSEPNPRIRNRRQLRESIRGRPYNGSFSDQT